MERDALAGGGAPPAHKIPPTCIQKLFALNWYLGYPSIPLLLVKLVKHFCWMLPSYLQWPCHTYLSLGMVLDGRSYPELGLRLKNWLPQTLARYARALSRLSPTLYKNASAPLSRGWFLRIEADL
jgi:hypothetical protein